jgi:hypothetical protein
VRALIDDQEEGFKIASTAKNTANGTIKLSVVPARCRIVA